MGPSLPTLAQHGPGHCPRRSIRVCYPLPTWQWQCQISPGFVEPKTKQKLANAAGGYSRTLLQLLATKKQFGSRCRQSYAPNGDFWRRNKNRRNGKAFFVCASGSTGSESHSPGFGETRRWKRWKLKIPIRNPANWHPKKTQKATWQRLLSPTPHGPLFCSAFVAPTSTYSGPRHRWSWLNRGSLARKAVHDTRKPDRCFTTNRKLILVGRQYGRIMRPATFSTSIKLPWSNWTVQPVTMHDRHLDATTKQRCSLSQDCNYPALGRI